MTPGQRWVRALGARSWRSGMRKSAPGLGCGWRLVGRRWIPEHDDDRSVADSVFEAAALDLDDAATRGAALAVLRDLACVPTLLPVCYSTGGRAHWSFSPRFVTVDEPTEADALAAAAEAVATQLSPS